MTLHDWLNATRDWGSQVWGYQESRRPAMILERSSKYESRDGRMRPRNFSDYRSIAWVAIAIAVVVAQYSNPKLVVYLSPISCYLAIACGTIAHNHNHRATFRNRRLNNGFGHVLTFFYGYPTLMWIPTHSLNHHQFVNRPGDATATWRYTNKHNLWVALTYPFVSGYFQSIPIREYISRMKVQKPSLYARIRFQYALWISALRGHGHLGRLSVSPATNWTGTLRLVLLGHSARDRIEYHDHVL